MNLWTYKMKTIYAKESLTILAVLLAVFLFPFEASASHNSCRIKAGSNEVQVRVFDRDQDGNPIRNAFTYGEIWKGVIKKGQSKSLKSSHGLINYSFRSLSDSRTYGGNFSTCTHGEIIRIP